VETTISSMQAQVYARWELCIAAEASAAPELRAMLSRHAAADSRIRPLFVPDTERSPHACHAALRNAAGEWIALLEQGHVLAESALAQVAEVVGRDPGLRLVFADGEPSAHLRVYRADLLREVAGSTPGLAGAHDADLPLHCVERLQPRQMHHIPGVLHRWQPDE
jgi:hypothetical protein